MPPPARTHAVARNESRRDRSFLTRQEVDQDFELFRRKLLAERGRHHALELLIALRDLGVRVHDGLPDVILVGALAESVERRADLPTFRSELVTTGTAALFDDFLGIGGSGDGPTAARGSIGLRRTAAGSAGGRDVRGGYIDGAAL